LALLTYFDSKLTSETINHFRHVGGTPWTGDQPAAMPLPPQDSKGKGKVVPLLFLTEHHAIKVYWGMEV
jgi:hypothetical protein